MKSRPDKKIFAVCFVKNEEDIIADSLRHAAGFCDRIYVIDNASDDRTWDIVLGLDLPPVVPVASLEFVFRDYHRVWFMGWKQAELGRNNWWYILDADMFLDGDPREAVAGAEEEGADAIAVNVVNFHLAGAEVEAARREGREEGWRDRVFYHLYESGEVFLFRNTGYLDYETCAGRPLGLTREYSRRLVSRHYPCRSAEQLAKRIRSRTGNPEFQPQLKKGPAWEGYLIDPDSFAGIKTLDPEKGIDLSGGFSRVLPPLGREGRSRRFSRLVRVLYPLGLLPMFYAFYNRYAARRQKVDDREKADFLAKLAGSKA